jgi:hypothetical protein
MTPLFRGKNKWSIILFEKNLKAFSRIIFFSSLPLQRNWNVNEVRNEKI